MRILHPLARSVAVLSAVLLLTLTVGCSKKADLSNTGVASSTPAQAAPTSQGKAISKLGDLSAFLSIATDVANIVDKGDLPAARARIKDLEVAWDRAEAGLKPRAANDWHVLDHAIDASLTTLRADSSSQADCRKAMTELLKTFDIVEGK